MAPRTKAVGASAPAETATDGAAGEVVELAVAGDTAAATELSSVTQDVTQGDPVALAVDVGVLAQVDEVASEASAPVAPVWPRMVTLRNNSGLQLVEPITGKFLFSVSSVVAELHSQEQADAVKENLRALESVNRLGDGVLAIDGLPV
nr:hypothetical protein [uncultured Rhodoferax sp.]